MSADYSGFQSLLSSIEWLQREFYTFNKKFLLEMGMRALGKTKQLTPRDTGALVGKWQLSRVYRVGNELYIDLFNPQEYASFVEDGHMQDERFLPIEYLEESKSSKPFLNELYQKYGHDIPGVMLHRKWIPGHHMARIAITQIEQQIPKRYEAAFKKWIKELGVE